MILYRHGLPYELSLRLLELLENLSYELNLRLLELLANERFPSSACLSSLVLSGNDSYLVSMARVPRRSTYSRGRSPSTQVKLSHIPSPYLISRAGVRHKSASFENSVWIVSGGLSPIAASAMDSIHRHPTWGSILLPNWLNRLL